MRGSSYFAMGVAIVLLNIGRGVFQCENIQVFFTHRCRIEHILSIVIFCHSSQYHLMYSSDESYVVNSNPVIVYVFLAYHSSLVTYRHASRLLGRVGMSSGSRNKERTFAKITKR